MQHLSEATVVQTWTLSYRHREGSCANKTENCGAQIPTLLSKIPDEFKPLAALGVGAVILVFIVLFHGTCLHWILVQRTREERRLSMGKPRVIAALLQFGLSVFLMLALHVVEIMIWAFALKGSGLIVHANDAIYFCANCYTTLGMGKLDVGEHWRIMNSIIGISGLFTFAWTTSVLVDVVATHRRLLNQLEEERIQEMHLRMDLRKQEWDALKAERDAEQAEEQKVQAAAAGLSFIQKFRIRREERKSIAELRREKVAGVEELRRQERLKENELGGKPAGNDPKDNHPQ